MNKKNIIIFLSLLIIFLVAIFFLSGRQLSINTDETEYELGEFPVITIRNNLTETVCFSECYRYYLERENGEWASYFYTDCPWPNVIERCLEPKEAMGLELIIEEAEIGLHRAAVPVCLNCSIGEEFREDQIFYSNKFKIN